MNRAMKSYRPRSILRIGNSEVGGETDLVG